MSGRGLLLPALAAFLGAAAAVAWVGNDPEAGGTIFGRLSVHNRDETGLSIAYAYLAERAARSGSGASVGTLTRPLAPEVVDPRAVVLRMGPDVPPHGIGSRLLTDDEEAWVRGGGRLVIGIEGPYGPASVARAEPGDGFRRTFPAWDGVQDLYPPEPRVLVDRAPEPAHALFLLGDRPLVSRRVIGLGEVILLACPETLMNPWLPLPGHLALLEALAGEGRSVLFDEASHGLRSRSGIADVLGRFRLGPLAALLALAAALTFWRGRVRAGPPEEARRQDRTGSMDLVEAVGRLYERTLPRRDAVALYYDALVREAAARTGLRGAALDAKVRELARGRGRPASGSLVDMTPPEFRRWVGILNDAHVRLEHADVG